MGDWLHCNTCYQQPGDGRLCYFLTSCGHTYCERCQDKGWKEKCLLCGTAKPSALKLTSKLTPPVDAYFSEPIRMMKQIHSEFKQLIATSEFQHHQRKRFVAQLQKNISNQKAIVKQHEKELEAKMYSQFDNMQREMAKLKEENNYLKRILSEKSHGGISRSPSGDKNRMCGSPVQKAFVTSSSPINMYQRNNNSSSLGGYRQNTTCLQNLTSVTSGRISVRTPPSGGRLGVIPPCTPSPKDFMTRATPKSVPHPIGFDVNMDTPPR